MEKLAMYTFWLVFVATVRCDIAFVYFKHKHNVNINNAGLRNGGQSLAKSLVQCAALHTIKRNKACFFYVKGTMQCRPDVGKQQCNYQTKGKRTLFLTVHQGFKATFFLHTLSDESPVSVVWMRELFSVRGPVSDAAYNIRSHTIHWIGKKNSRWIFKKILAGHRIYRHKVSERVLGIAIDNRNDLTFYLYHNLITMGFQKRYNKYPLKYSSTPGYGYIALNTKNRGTFFTVRSPIKRKVQLVFLQQGNLRGERLAYETREDIKAFVLDPGAPYAYSCMRRLSRIGLVSHRVEKILPTPSGTHCSVMTEHQRQIFVMVKRGRKFSVAVISMRRGDLMSMIELPVQHRLTGMDILEM